MAVLWLKQLLVVCQIDRLLCLLYTTFFSWIPILRIFRPDNTRLLHFKFFCNGIYRNFSGFCWGRWSHGDRDFSDTDWSAFFRFHQSWSNGEACTRIKPIFRSLLWHFLGEMAGGRILYPKNSSPALYFLWFNKILQK